MRKLILTMSVVVILVFAAAVPALASPPPEDSVPGEPNCFGKMASGQVTEHGGYQNAADFHSGGSVKNATDGGKAFCAS